MSKIFFYKRKKDGFIFSVGEKEASEFGRFHELIGVSDGSLYEEMTREAAEKFLGLQKELVRYQENKTEPPSEFWEKYYEVKRLFEEKSREAFQAELEKAKGKFIKPRDFSKIDLETGEPINI